MEHYEFKMPSIYLVETSKLTKAAGGCSILQELTGHLVTVSKTFKWPEKFWVEIDLETYDDTDGLKYFADENRKEPFMVMGYSDTGYYTVVALMTIAGTKIEE